MRFDRRGHALALMATSALYVAYLRWLWLQHHGLTLNSADDATRLLLAYSWGRYGVFPLH
jgi:hypothetical protein